MLSLPIADEPLPRPGKLLRIIGQKNPYSFNKGCIKGGMPVFGRQKKAVVTALGLPEDVFLGEMLLSMTGNASAVVENYRSIVFFSDTVLKLQGKNARMTVTGRGLSIAYYDREQLKVTGQICAVEFESYPEVQR